MLRRGCVGRGASQEGKGEERLARQGQWGQARGVREGLAPIQEWAGCFGDAGGTPGGVGIYG